MTNYIYCYADNIVLICDDVNKLQCIINTDDVMFSRFGLNYCLTQTKTISSNVPEETTKTTNLYKMLGNSNLPDFLSNQISSAYSNWNELTNVLLDKRIHLSTRV